MIIDEFGSSMVKNVDLKAELILQLQNLTHEECEKIKRKREEFLAEIDKVKNFNLNSLEEKFLNEEPISLDPNQLFQNFCFILDNFDNKKSQIDPVYGDFIDEAFGYLIICDRFVLEDIINTYKQLNPIYYSLGSANVSKFLLKNNVRKFIFLASLIMGNILNMI